MSSREIAEYTGKRHDNVVADIRKMLTDLGITALIFQDSYKDSTGRSLPMFQLPKDLTITLVSGYSAPMRHAIVKRWLELEAKEQATPKVPITSFTFAKGMTLRAVLKDNQPWFVAKDVCEALGYAADVSATLAKHVDDDDRMPINLGSIAKRDGTSGGTYGQQP